MMSKITKQIEEDEEEKESEQKLEQKKAELRKSHKYEDKTLQQFELRRV